MYFVFMYYVYLYNVLHFILNKSIHPFGVVGGELAYCIQTSSQYVADTCRYHVRVDYNYNRLDCDCPLPCK